MENEKLENCSRKLIDLAGGIMGFELEDNGKIKSIAISGTNGMNWEGSSGIDIGALMNIANATLQCDYKGPLIIVDRKASKACLDGDFSKKSSINECIDDFLGIYKRAIKHYGEFKETLRLKGVTSFNLLEAIVEHKVDIRGEKNGELVYIAPRFKQVCVDEDENVQLNGLYGFPNTKTVNELDRLYQFYIFSTPIVIDIQNNRIYRNYSKSHIEKIIKKRYLEYAAGSDTRYNISLEEARNVFENYHDYLDRYYASLERFVQEVEVYKT